MVYITMTISLTKANQYIESEVTYITNFEEKKSLHSFKTLFNTNG